MKMVKCIPEFEYFYCILEKLIYKIRISKVTDYAALKVILCYLNIALMDRSSLIVYVYFYLSFLG